MYKIETNSCLKKANLKSKEMAGLTDVDGIMRKRAGYVNQLRNLIILIQAFVIYLFIYLVAQLC